METIAIKVNNLSKSYRLYKKASDRLREVLHPLRKTYHEDFHALTDVSFEIKKGDCVGIIGRNGCGKSTLLKLLAGVLHPTSGTIEVTGRVAALLELGAGFNPEFTGLENIYLNGNLMGFTEKEMDRLIPDILSFAEIGEFVNQPVRNYSSGMFVRLAFSIFTVVRPDILIVDEALSVGDMYFQAKCMEKMHALRKLGTTVIFVSHDLSTIRSFCNKAMFLRNGQIVKMGGTQDVTELYYYDNNASDAKLNGKTADSPLSDFHRIKKGGAELTNIRFLNSLGEEVKTVKFGENLSLELSIKILSELDYIDFGIHIRDRNGLDLLYSDSLIEKIVINDLKTGEFIRLKIGFRVNLSEGDYTVATMVSRVSRIVADQYQIYDFIPIAKQFSVEAMQPRLFGKSRLEGNFELERLSPSKDAAP